MFLKYVCSSSLVVDHDVCVCVPFSICCTVKKKNRKKINNRNMPKLQHHFASIHAPRPLRASTFWQQIPLKR